MLDEATVRLVSALAIPEERAEAAQRLAARFGALGLLILVEDRAAGAFVPASGFPKTLPGGPLWRAFVAEARRQRFFVGVVGHPEPERATPAVAYTDAGTMLVFVGTRESGPIAALDVVMPLLAATMRLEHDELVARGELRVAHEHAREVQNLARALDAARAEVERTVQALGRQARELEEARARAETAALAKDEFLAMLGHELRNPLSPILTALQLMRLKQQASRELDVIERQVRSLMRLVDDLLDVSRITQGKVELRKELVELADIAARAIELSSPVLEQKRQRLELAIPARGLLVEADPSRLAQVLANLLTNAAKYSDPETQIDFGADAHDGRVRIRVRDRGMGIRPDMLEQVFELFVQNRQGLERSQGGLGLGLPIARNLVALHGGTVRAFSEGEGRGSEFVVELAQPDPQQLRSRRDDAPDVVVPRTESADRVLVVDDNEDAATMLSEALDALGYVVRTAADGPSALEIAAEFEPSLALLDIGLPVMDGYELAERLRERKPAGELRLVAVTGYGQRDDRRRSDAKGFEAHLVKPIDLGRLQQVLRDLREHARAARRAEP